MEVLVQVRSDDSMHLEHSQRYPQCLIRFAMRVCENCSRFEAGATVWRSDRSCYCLVRVTARFSKPEPLKAPVILELVVSVPV
jgi:hypothetical protein